MKKICFKIGFNKALSYVSNNLYEHKTNKMIGYRIRFVKLVVQVFKKETGVKIPFFESILSRR